MIESFVFQVAIQKFPCSYSATNYGLCHNWHDVQCSGITQDMSCHVILSE